MIQKKESGKSSLLITSWLRGLSTEKVSQILAIKNPQNLKYLAQILNVGLPAQVCDCGFRLNENNKFYKRPSFNLKKIIGKVGHEAEKLKKDKIQQFYRNIVIDREKPHNVSLRRSYLEQKSSLLEILNLFSLESFQFSILKS